MDTLVITAALARKPRRCPHAIQRRCGGGGIKKSAHNYVAQTPKKPAGAALGNRNAARRDRQTVERHVRMDALVQQMCAMADAVNLAAGIARLERQSLIRLLAETRRG